MIDYNLIKIIKTMGSRVLLLGSHDIVEKTSVQLQMWGLTPSTAESYTVFTDVVIILDTDTDFSVLNRLQSWITVINLLPPDMCCQGPEAFSYQNGELTALSDYSGPRSQFLHDTTEYQIQVMAKFPELHGREDDLRVVYAGAVQLYGLQHLPFSEFLAGVTPLAEQYKNIVFFNADETMQPSSLIKCQRAAELLQHTDCKFFYLSGCQDADVRFEQFCSENNVNPLLNMVSYFSFEMSTIDNYSLSTDQFKQELNKPYDVKLKPYNFLCFNRVSRIHRCILVARLIQHKLLDKCLISFHGSDNMSVELDMYAKQNKYTTEHEILAKNDHLFPLVLNRSSHRDNPIDTQPDDMQYYANSYVSLVSETVFYDQSLISDFMGGVFFSEKIYKPILCKHPFILLASTGALRELRACGYKTFHPYIDESYDLCQDDDARMDMLVAEINRLSSFTDEQWLQFQKSVAPILEYNHNLLLAPKDLRVTKDLLDHIV